MFIIHKHTPPHYIYNFEGIDINIYDLQKPYCIFLMINK